MTDDPDKTVESAADDGGVVARGGKIGPFHIDGMIGSGAMGIVLAGRDPDLDRPVAIKVLHAGRSRDRLMREAQAMARVTHPNTIAIYEVGRAGEEVFIAMELVAGTSLRAWLETERRTWREHVTMFIAAGRGLAAIHAAGVVHRDFKPQNVMVRADGRPQVGDFGLAADGILPEVDGGSAALARSMMSGGEVVGTPTVMAPEQWRGETVDARADQFAFAVSLWWALFGEHPFPHDDVPSLRAAVLAGQRRPAGKRAVPDRITRAVERGLALDPADRWPRLDELLARLESGLGARRRLAISAGLVAGTAGIAAVSAFVMARDAAPEPCPAPTAQISEVWNADHARALRAHMIDVDPAQGATRFESAERAIAPFLASWRELRVDTCRATRVRGEQSDTMLDLRQRCLDARLAELAASLHYLARATTPQALDDAQVGLLGVAPVADCRSDVRLTQLLALPADPAERAIAEDVDARMIDLGAAYRASQLDGLAVRVAGALADAREIESPPTLANVLRLAANLANAEGRVDDETAYYREAIQVAARAGDAWTEASAWLGLVSRLRWMRPDEALALVAGASSAIARAGDPVDMRVNLLRLQASLHSRRGDAQLATDELAEALRLIEAEPERTPTLEMALNNVLFEMGNHARTNRDFEGAAAHFRAAIEPVRRAVGKDSFLEAIALDGASDALFEARKYDEALAANAEAMRIMRSRVGESARLAEYAARRALIFDAAGRLEESLAAYLDAVTMMRKHFGLDDLRRAFTLAGYALALGRAERIAEAEAIYDEVIGLYERAGARNVDLPIALFNRAELRRVHGRCRDAIPLYQRATAEFVAQQGETSQYLVYPLVGEASCTVTVGQAAAALPMLERAVALPDVDALRTAMARAWLGRALVESRRGPAKGLAMARDARAAMAKITNDVEAPRELRELDRWLATR